MFCKCFVVQCPLLVDVAELDGERERERERERESRRSYADSSNNHTVQNRIGHVYFSYALSLPRAPSYSLSNPSSTWPHIQIAKGHVYIANVPENPLFAIYTIPLGEIVFR